jgi:hypothetical protein
MPVEAVAVAMSNKPERDKEEQQALEKYSKENQLVVAVVGVVAVAVMPGL